MKPLLVLLSALLLGQHVQAAPANIQSTFLDGFKGPFPTLGGYAGTEISSTVSLLYQNDWDVNYLVSMTCPASSFTAARATSQWLYTPRNQQFLSNCISMLVR
jgi:hypothetical protein